MNESEKQKGPSIDQLREINSKTKKSDWTGREVTLNVFVDFFPLTSLFVFDFSAVLRSLIVFL